MASVARSGPLLPAATRATAKPRLQIASRFDYLQTYAMSGLTSLCGLTAFRLAHHSFGNVGFAEYALIRRVIAFLVPLLSLGMAVAIAKFVALRTAVNRGDQSLEFLSGGILATLASVTAYGAIALLFPRFTALLCTGSGERGGLMWDLLPLLAGAMLTTSVGTYCRGRMWIATSNALQLLSAGIIPTLMLLGIGDLKTYLWHAGAAICAAGVAALAVIYFASSRGRWWPSWATSRALLQFGLPRVPGDVAYYGLLVVPAIAATFRAGVQAGGEVAYALAWLTLLGQLVAPLSLLLLPEAAYLIHSGHAHVLQRRLDKLLRYSLLLTTVLVLMLVWWAPQVIALHLGTASASLVHTVRITLPAAIPLNVFICLRSVIDAGETRAVGPRLCLAAFAAFAAALWVFPGGPGSAAAVTYAFLFASGLLALLCVWAAHRVFDKYRPDVTEPRDTRIEPQGT
jgi:O-antigen/teichoic acid export membrane protein